MRAEISKEMSNYVSDGQWQFLPGKMQPRRFSCHMSERKPADKSDFIIYLTGKLAQNVPYIFFRIHEHVFSVIFSFVKASAVDKRSHQIPE